MGQQQSPQDLRIRREQASMPTLYFSIAAQHPKSFHSLDPAAYLVKGELVEMLYQGKWCSLLKGVFVLQRQALTAMSAANYPPTRSKLSFLGTASSASNASVCY
jgi:hypothetical protein